MIHLRDRRMAAANVNDLLTNAVAGIGILGAAAGALPVRTPVGAVLVAAEAVAGCALLVMIAREIRELRAGTDRTPARVAWVSVFAAAVMFAEVAQRYQERGRIFRPLLLTAVFTLVMAFLQPRIKRRQAGRRGVRVDDHGIAVRLGPFRRFEAAWGEIARLQRHRSTVRVEMRGGRTRSLRFRYFTNRDEVFDALAAQAARRGVPAAGLAAGARPAAEPASGER